LSKWVDGVENSKMAAAIILTFCAAYADLLPATCSNSRWKILVLSVLDSTQQGIETATYAPEKVQAEQEAKEMAVL
jgi:hypothetical protein